MGVLVHDMARGAWAMERRDGEAWDDRGESDEAHDEEGLGVEEVGGEGNRKGLCVVCSAVVSAPKFAWAPGGPRGSGGSMPILSGAKWQLNQDEMRSE